VRSRKALDLLRDPRCVYTVQVWAADLDALFDLARQRVTRSLTVEECRQYLHLARCPRVTKFSHVRIVHFTTTIHIAATTTPATATNASTPSHLLDEAFR
jgi:hypothetical protein